MVTDFFFFWGGGGGGRWGNGYYGLCEKVNNKLLDT